MMMGMDKNRYFASVKLEGVAVARTASLGDHDLEILLRSEKKRRESDYSFGEIRFTKIEYWGTYISAITNREEVVTEEIELSWKECSKLLETLEKGGNIR